MSLKNKAARSVVGIDVQHPLVALGGAVVLLAVLVHQAEVHQRADVGGEAAGGPLVEFHGHVVVAAAVVFQGQAEQGAGVVAVGLDGPLVQGHDFVGISAEAATVAARWARYSAVCSMAPERPSSTARASAAWPA